MILQIIMLKMDKYIFGPSIFISCISGIASFMSTTDLAENTQSIRYKCWCISFCNLVAIFG